ncbi:hypothetical protein SAMN05444411_102134 [Lutibacter oricola]|uniref:DUF5916 domain-containing protein n=1 Tax=Lutibacter oricola TaxID=762486 RepID=A0A1H2W922_9FLAO|nr:DUF5916 domain-containing protein [Lutibacter oricola]SDW76774.1 hypothetical protein SAMN05444411_102134 [Lutibacter oricola]
MKNKLFLIALFIAHLVQSQINPNPKSVNALRIENAPKIDGVLNEDFWLVAEEMKDFVMFRPGTGNKEPKNKKTIVKVAYDDLAIYFGAYLYDDDIKNISLQSSTRDNFGQVDWFGIMINPLNDGQNDTEFFIQATGNQADAKATPNNEDFSWSGVWQSAVKIDDEKWVIEVKIPYSELRFSNEKVQTWGLNFHRKFNISREQYTWNFIDRTKGNIQQYAGELTGLENISPPIRLSFFPYASGSYASFDGTNEFDSSFGMDVKFGINEAFTLDATLIPDFGQTEFDNITLNLSPFEQQFSEKRAFFTEGTELFEKGDLFYSRRVGNSPTTYVNSDDLEDDEEISNEPSSVDMLNAIKISGRNKKGLGIGFFNAITQKTEATIKKTKTDSDTNEEIVSYRKQITEPFANYNVLVLDQQFNKNSSVSFVNTNVWREGSFRDANVTALLFDLTNKANKYKLEGGGALSTINEFGKITTGFSSDIAFRDISGNWQWGIENHIQDTKFDKNDLGFQRRNNFNNFETYLSYRIFEPTEKLNNFRITFWNDFDYLFKPSKFTESSAGINYYMQFKKNNLAYGGNINGNIGKEYDFFEPRVEGRYFKKPSRAAIGQWISTDYNKKLALDTDFFVSQRLNDNNTFFKFGFSPRYRFTDNLLLVYEFNFALDANDKGYVTVLDTNDIIFGERDTKEFVNAISGKYNFSTKSALGLTFRHYWSPVKYDKEYYLLEQKGNLTEYSNYSENNDINYNIWNLDLNYTWEFAPGSQLIALYRNSIFNSDQLADLNFKDNLDNLFEQPALHNVSLRLVYYIDYNKAKNWL